MAPCDNIYSNLALLSFAFVDHMGRLRTEVLMHKIVSLYYDHQDESCI